MEANLQETEAVDTTLATPIGALEGSALGTQPLLPPATKPNTKWQQIGTQISDFLSNLPDNTVRFFIEYNQPIITVALIVAAIVTLKVVFAVLDSINDIPLIYPTFELIGIGYTTWFVFRYLIQASTRQELAAQIQSIKNEISGSST
ncbi:CAAD domain-containing protein [Mastigocladopsis repens]|uniref:CAAD domain-containing protein n=1 Tax=Mastigocladopsis repens TaxID=221287 RepID=UPI0002E96EE9|nr:CAAD domain-containing protein [Mastigocladopsis repens]